MNDEPDNIIEKELKTYNCPECGKIICRGMVLSLALTCPHCNKFVRITKKPQK